MNNVQEPLMRTALMGMLDQFVKRQPEWVLFTTFNFSAAFFEANILPLLAGSSVEELAGSAENRKELNAVLEQVKTLVVCDRSAWPEPKKEYRYGVMPVGLARGRFHPKIILMAGELAAGGGYGLWLAVGSANLSISGWALNREVVGVTRVVKKHRAELERLLQWLQEQAEKRIGWLGGDEYVEEGQPRSVLDALRVAVAKHAREGHPQDPTLHIGLDTDSKPLLEALTTGGPWERATVVSPFWGEVAELSRRIGARETHFVPSLVGEGRYGFPFGMIEPVLSRKFFRFKDGADRYTHAKAMLLQGPMGNVLAIGSANFTGAALLNGQGALSNVEAVLRYECGRAEPWRGIFIPLEDSERSEQAEGEDASAPELPPFEAEAFCDWKKRRFFFRLLLYPGVDVTEIAGELAGESITLTLDPKVPQKQEIPFRGLRPVTNFYVFYRVKGGEAQRFQGLVTQLNAADDDLGYHPRPRLDAVLELLRNLDSTKGDGGGGGSRGEGDGGEEATYEPTFDFFPFFQATYKMRGYYAKNPQLTPFSKSAPQGLPMLLRAVRLQPAETPEAVIGRYVQLSEIRELAETFASKRQAEDDFPDELLQEELEALKVQVAKRLLESKAFKQMLGGSLESCRVEALLKWFQQELKTVVARVGVAGCQH